MIKSARDVEWELTVNKSDLIRISLRATDSQVATFRHALTIVIPHPDYTKEIRQTFNMDTGGHTFNVLIMHKISEQEFCNPGGDLVMKIGIRPLNSIVEKQLAIYQYVQLKEANEKLTKRLTYFTDEYDYKHLTMYFNIELEQFKRYRFLKSYGICDGENREWRMTMKLNSKNMIATHIQLIRGAGTECRFFIELEHMNLQKSIRKSSICKKFDFGNGTKPMWGFKFIEFDELKADAGFLRNDLLHFRFGVRPLLSTTVVYDDSRTLTKSATTPAEPNVRRTSWKSRSGRKLVRKAAAKTHAKLNVDPLLQAKEAIDDGSTSLETGNGSAILKSGGDRKETAEETQPKQNVRSLSPDTGKLKWYQKLLPGNSQTSARQRVRPLSPASESDDDRQTVRQTAVMTPAEPYVALYSPASEVFGGGRSLSMSSGGRTHARQTAAMTPVEPTVRPLSPAIESDDDRQTVTVRQTAAMISAVRPLSPATDSDDDHQIVRQTAARTPVEPYGAFYSPASEVFGGGRSLSMSSGGRTLARQTVAMAPVEPSVRPLSPAAESYGDRQTVRQTAATTPAEPYVAFYSPASEVFGGGRSLSMSSVGRTHARQTAASTAVEPTVRPFSPATESNGDRQTVRQTAAKTHAEPNEGTSNPAKEKHVSFVE
ncbi:uncharacterized protein LOC109417957 isoform X2 [Aedes albopictus]|uniref:MATH domain-containing protein n=1 Tax=Aedes albopictus TaxID=7160 RepID=A0ABM2A0U6_AEDAL